MRFHEQFSFLQLKLINRGSILLNREILTIKSFPFFVIFAVLLYFTALATFSISIDDEKAALRTNHEVWISQGRWGIYLFQTFIFSQAVVPYFSNFLFVLFVVTAYLFIIRTYNLKVNFYTYALFPIFCAFPTWAFLSEFYANISVSGLGLLLASIAIYLFSHGVLEKIVNSERISYQRLMYHLIAPTILVATAVGIYQSFILLFISMGFGIIVFFSLENKINFAKILKAIAILCVLLVLSLLLYYIIQCFALYMSNKDITYIVESFYKPEIFFENPFKVIKKIILQMGAVYIGAPILYETSLIAIGLIMLLGLSAVFFNKKLAGKPPKIKAIILLLVMGVLVAPFSLNIFSGGYMPLRSFVGVPFVLWFFALLALTYSQVILRSLVLLLLIIGTLQIMYAHSLYTASMLLVQKNDEMMASNIYQRIAEVNSDFDRDKIYRIYFYGANYFANIYPSVMSTTMSGSFFSWDNGNPYRMLSYMKLMGMNNLELLDKNLYDKFNPYFTSMPSWPASGSVKVIDNVTLVKLSNK